MTRRAPRVLALVLALVGCQAVVNFEAPREAGEQCTDGLDNDGNGMTDCLDPSCAGVAACAGCGNGTLDDGEECDDGNTIPDDGCSPDCKLDAGCGNGRVEGNEECDDGNDVDTDGCRVTCRLPFCGDGAVQAGEQCDDGNVDDTDGCLTECRLATCGDGFVQAGVEECDDANLLDNDGCNACVLERCGDAIVQTAPGVSSVDFEWLASSCEVEPGNIAFQIGGVTVLDAVAEETASCTCSPPGSSIVTITDPAVLALVINGNNQFAVDYTGTGKFLAWASVTVNTEAGATPIVVYEGEPGAAAAHVQAMCSPGFAESVARQSLAPVAVFESCDDGNTTNGDGCDNDCRSSR